jgi:hypothetical protein
MFLWEFIAQKGKGQQAEGKEIQPQASGCKL